MLNVFPVLRKIHLKLPALLSWAWTTDPQAILMTQGHLVQEYRFRSKDGHYLWIRDEASLLRKADGRPPKEIVGFWTNIAERKQQKNGQRKRASKSSRGAS